MKNLLPLFQTFVLGFIMITSIACSDDDDDGVSPPVDAKNIVEIALETPELTALVSALQAADGDLVNVLQGDGPFTVLAPTNAAFTTFLASNGFGSVADVPSDVLAEILLNHVIAADVSSGDLASAGTGYANTEATGSGGNRMSVYFNATSGVRFNNVAAVTDGGADIDASNGTIHIIDAVIPLPSILTHASVNSNFTSLVTALGAADGNLIDVLGGDGLFTVLAPDNAAFETFLDGGSLGGVNTAVLSRILLNHVLDGATSSSDLASIGAGYTNTSVNGPGENPMSLYFNTSGGVTFNGISSVSEADIVGTNGIIHAVDAVIGLPTVVTFATADPNFSTLVTALTELTPATDFVSILSRTEGDNLDGFNPEFTVFAPNNDAFAIIEEFPAETVLTQILLHHVVAENNIASGDLVTGDNTVPTLEGDDITITVPGTDGSIADVTDGSGNSLANIIAVDVQADNGVIHVLDGVLLPNIEN